MPKDGPGRSARLRLLAAAYIVSCIVTDLFPTYGPPFFRYTGADPSFHVWNLGWPLALAIYDTRSGLHLGLFLYLVLPVQMMIALLATVAVAIRNKHNKSLQWMAGRRCGFNSGVAGPPPLS
jgi:hypothetical protein